METERLRQFCTIVDTGSFTQAAKLLGISHSGLSKSIAALETELKLELFRPLGRGVLVTEKGKELYREAQKILAQIENMKRGFNRQANVPVRLGVFEVFTAHFMGHLASTYLQGRPLECLEMGPGQIEAALLESRIDFGISYVPVPSEGVEHLEIAQMSLGIYVRVGTFKKTPVQEIPFVFPSIPLPQNPLGVKERDGWPESLFPRNKVYSTNLLSTALDFTRSGLCAIFIPDHLAEMHNQVTEKSAQLVRVPLPSKVPSIRRPVFLVKRVQSEEGPEMKKVCRAVRELCR